MSMSGRTSPRAMARSNVTREVCSSRCSVEERCSAAIRSSRTDSAIDVRRKASPSGVFTNASTDAVALPRGRCAIEPVSGSGISEEYSDSIAATARSSLEGQRR